jgi:HEAT repeat protein
MRVSKGKAVALGTMAFALLGFLCASPILKELLVERWYIGQLDSYNYQQHKRALLRLGKMGSIRAIPKLLWLAAKSDHSGTQTAIEMIIEKGGKAAFLAIAQVLRHEDRWVRNVAARKLAEIGPDAEAAVPQLKEALHHPDRFTAMLAAEALFEIGVEKGAYFSEVLGTLLDPDPLARQEAAHVIVLLGKESQPPLPMLLECLRMDLNASSKYVFNDPQMALATTGDVPAVTALLSDPEAKVRGAGARIIALMGPEAASAVPALSRLLGDEDGEVRREAVRALGLVGEKAASAAPSLAQLLDNTDEELKGPALTSLREMGTGAAPAVPSLLRWMGEKPARLKDGFNVLKAVGPGAATALPTLLRALENEDEGVRVGALQVLKRMGPAAGDAHQALEKARHHQSAKTRVWAACVLDGIHGGEVKKLLPAMLRSLKGENDDSKVTAADILAELGPAAKEAVPLLVRAALGTKSEALISEASLALARIGMDAGEMKPLIEALQRNYNDRRQCATEVLWDLGEGAFPVVPLLIERLRDTDPYVRQSAACLLCRIGPAMKDHVPALKQALRSHDPSVRHSVRRALAKLVEDPAPAQLSSGLGSKKSLSSPTPPRASSLPSE